MAERQVVLRDTTLREGVQIPGSRVAFEDRQRFVELLDEVGVPEIEIGLPDGVDACAELARFIGRRGLRIAPTGLVPFSRIFSAMVLPMGVPVAASEKSEGRWPCRRPGSASLPRPAYR